MRVHDPLADPLTPYWRQKVEVASRASALATPHHGPRRTHGLTPREHHYVSLVRERGLTVRDAAAQERVCRSNIDRALRVARKLEEVGA